MSRKKITITNLTDNEFSTLQEGWKKGKSHAFRIRCQCILMSYQSCDVESIGKICFVNKNTVYAWLKSWKKHGIIGLITKPGQGRKPSLSLDNSTHVKVIEKAVKNAAQNGTNMIAEILEALALEKDFSHKTLRRFLKKKTIKRS